MKELTQVLQWYYRQNAAFYTYIVEQLWRKWVIFRDTRL